MRPSVVLPALLVAVCAWAGEVFLRAPVPLPGVAITQAAQYAVDAARLAHPGGGEDERLSLTFVASFPDEASRQFLSSSRQRTATRFGQAVAYWKRTMFWSLQRYLGWKRPDASGFLQLADLYVASTSQFRDILGGNGGNGGNGGGGATLLDIGSGTGTETAKLATALGIENPQHVMCLESSSVMQKKLQQRDFQTAGDYATAIAAIPSHQYYAASLLNVLDRVDDPAGLIDLTVKHIEPGGVLLLAIVLPFWPAVHEGKIGSKWGRARKRKVRRPLDVATLPETASFEERASVFLDAILKVQPQLRLERWTKLPYLSSGDTFKTHYSIEMALMAFRVPGGHGNDRSGGVTSSSGSLTRKNIPAKCKGRSGDKIYNWLASTLSKAKQGSTPSSSVWGKVLDAGAGYGSMCWLLHQEYDTITEVTATESGTYGASGLRQATALLPEVDIVVGNWRDLTFMPDTTYDIVVSDYLLGAVEQHWPFGAGAMMDRLLRAVRPGGYLLLIGLEPYEGVLDRSDNIHDRLVLDIEAIGDTAAAIVGEATYRELPEAWVRHEVSVPRHGGPPFRVVATEQFSMRLTRASLMRQVEYAKRTAEKIADRELRGAYQRRIKALQHELHAEWPEDFAHRRARNYAFVIKREGE